MPDPPISIAGHLDWLKQNLSRFPYGEVGLLFTLHDGMVVRVRRVCHQSFKTQGEEVQFEALPLDNE
jgi:hypothetical protein